MRYKDIKEQYIGKTMVFIGASDLQVNFFSGVDPPNFFEIGQELLLKIVKSIVVTLNLLPTFSPVFMVLLKIG